jgi:Uma2 family endonuclease
MTAVPKHKMTVDEFLAWSDTVPGRYELLDGVVYTMQSERVGHARVKHAVQNALAAALRASGQSATCEMLPDGMTVRVDAETAFEPDALVYCGTRLASTILEVPNPIIVVEVLSPSTRSIDVSQKLAGYFLIPSIQHYLIVNPQRLPVIHHARQADGTILTRLVTAGAITMTPPGIAISVDGLLD